MKKTRFIYVPFTMSFDARNDSWNMPYSHVHHDYEIYILLSGERTIQSGENTYFTHAGTAALFPSEISHRSYGNTPFTGICIHFSKEYLQTCYQPNTCKWLLSCFHTPVLPLPDSFIKLLTQETALFQETASKNPFLLGMILSELVSLHENGSPLPGINTSEESSPKIKTDILQYMNEEYLYIQTVEEIATRFQCSKRYIYKLTQAVYHMSPKEYINFLRLKEAEQRLQTTTAPVHAIAEECGYHSYEYFCRLFKEKNGCTPSAFRSSFFHNL